MFKTIEFRIYPKKFQITLLENTLYLCKNLYNAALEERISSWKKLHKNISKFDQNYELKEVKELLPEYKNVFSQVLRDTLIRLDKAYKNFFRRVKSGQTPGFPRWKNIKSYNSFTYPQFGFKFLPGQIQLSKIGFVKCKQHRNIPQNIKTCTVLRSKTNKWFVKLVYEVDKTPLIKTNKQIGIDVGIKNFAVFSDGKIIDNPKFLKHEQDNLARAQRKLSATTKRTKEFYKAKRVVNLIWEKIYNKRTNFAHQQSKKIVDDYDIICVEKLNIKNMIESSSSNKNLRKEISDACWSKFLFYISYKAENADKEYIEVEAKNTSKMCSSCGNTQEMLLSQREYNCNKCKNILDRDLNAAINILNRGIGLPIPREIGNTTSDENQETLIC
jgi:putative transposase